MYNWSKYVKYVLEICFKMLAYLFLSDFISANT